MNGDPNEVVKVYSGPLVVVETYHNALKEDGIESKVVGTSLTASFGTAIPDSVELWVNQKDFDQAWAAIARYEAEQPAPDEED